MFRLKIEVRHYATRHPVQSCSLFSYLVGIIVLIFFHFPRPWICKPFKNAIFSLRFHRPILLFGSSLESSEGPAARRRPRFVDRRFCDAAGAFAVMLEQESSVRGDRVSIMVVTKTIFSYSFDEKNVRTFHFCMLFLYF